MDELVFAIPTDELWNLISYKKKGFIKNDSCTLENIIQKGIFKNRDELEEDASYKQLIPYALLYCEEQDKQNSDAFFLFQRLSKQLENRLHNKFSLGIGGHMNPGNSSESTENYFLDELNRELFEEVSLSNNCKVLDITFHGFINDDTISVGRVHIGLLCTIQLTNKNVVINESDKMKAKWVDANELGANYNKMETWSQIAYESIIH